MTVEELVAARFELGLLYVDAIWKQIHLEWTMDDLDEEILVAKIVNLCLTGE